MGKNELIDILAQGVKVWNEWRKENKNIKIDLDDSDLSRIRNLQGVDFSNASLVNTSFYSNNLANANFSNANLELVIMRDTNCEQANFLNAILNLSNLQSVNLVGANFTNAVSGMATFKKCDFTGAIISNSIKLTLNQYSDQNIV
jgi:uncharacterized protein YjbI with pentapeptide repeats